MIILLILLQTSVSPRSSHFRRVCRPDRLTSVMIILLIPDRLTSDECVAPCVGSQPVFTPLQSGMDDSAGFPGDALDEADTLEVTVASAIKQITIVKLPDYIFD